LSNLTYKCNNYFNLSIKTLINKLKILKICYLIKYAFNVYIKKFKNKKIENGL